MVAEAILALQGASNLRDLGGYRTHDGRRTKWGLIYRSSELSTLTDHDVAYLLNLGIKQATLKHIKDNYGSVAAYLRDAAGVEDEVIERLRENLLQ